LGEGHRGQVIALLCLQSFELDGTEINLRGEEEEGGREESRSQPGVSTQAPHFEWNTVSQEVWRAKKSAEVLSFCFQDLHTRPPLRARTPLSHRLQPRSEPAL
jgi:hypothetical protein